MGKAFGLGCDHLKFFAIPCTHYGDKGSAGKEAPAPEKVGCWLRGGTDVHGEAQPFHSSGSGLISWGSDHPNLASSVHMCCTRHLTDLSDNTLTHRKGLCQGSQSPFPEAHSRWQGHCPTSQHRTSHRSAVLGEEGRTIRKRGP